MNVLFLGDVVGSPGRNAIKKALPEFKKKYKLDLVIVNVDNVTHGIGTTRDKVEELMHYGVDYFTNGDHVYRFKEFLKDLDDKNLPVLRPANYPEVSPGRGFDVIDLGKLGQVLLINLMGQVFLRDTLDSPFKKIDEILEQFKDVKFAAIIIDFHAEATSEKKALSYYLDGKVSLIVGTHTHIQTNDAMILKRGTGYITDLGMVGTKDSILGENINSILEHYKLKTPHRYTLEEEGKTALNGVFAEIDSKGITKKIRLVNVDVLS
ncbi:hypothetical protein A2X44_03745 [candidate division CPR3 bacterium GWF2_35_18]|uniref:Phosphoesterase family protein n=1 Tax=candidate division CPR3 bacterium GW2011_GWF2_35_18 TaxID=1618350 RepID=A0A0G0C0K3_UNCC3|nr:MAG: Phosphoesterase family protein [candidate division CPR3 bacterium GW2011_GWF2_35_18]KKP85474.1 MAG: Phosphoesterase family protein [candidate division CPR3 bacterium GW2011_GWE2_35_7]OGB63125.1 MAG: hypothetical protein A2X44_03745 [candidate division CPR3 bacterium GWF2_35_18]OGB64061.1 MAG: hypothetical protein A2250_04645 [candidate division CPR3 bacterium RIFOXYA2_FULL_35_13]OGB76216.1 MAG: hypothetical protein A2476_00730 [candidate division CPR3 bacterium RIFOXYC2_FULL_35_7]OGB79